MVTHPHVLRKPWESRAAVEFLRALTAAPSLSLLVPGDRHGEILDDLAATIPALTGNLWHDAETAVLMREHGIRRICTRDTDFHRFSFIEVVDPLVADP